MCVEGMECGSWSMQPGPLVASHPSEEQLSKAGLGLAPSMTFSKKRPLRGLVPLLSDEDSWSRSLIFFFKIILN